jgi:gamma-glutamylputrescine oxidase
MTTPYWLDGDRPSLPRRRLGAPPEVEIIGAGITGCTCAFALARAGVRVCVHDARRVAEGASGRNGGFVLRGGAARYDVARDSYGASAAQDLWRRTENALDRLESLVDGAVRRVGSLRLAADAEEQVAIRGEYEALQADGFDAEWREALPPPLAGRFDGAIFHPRDGAIQPAHAVWQLAALASSAGAEIREGSRVDALEQLEAEHVVIATDGSGRGLLPELDEAIWPARGQVVATEPLPERVFAYPHYARNGFDYWQQLPDGRVVAGGFRDYSILSELTDNEETTAVIQDALDEFLADMLGGAVPVSHRWAGIFGLTQDLLPLVGPVPGRERVWVAAGYSGHGNVLGFLAGELVADAILGRSDPLLELFRPARLLVS